VHLFLMFNKFVGFFKSLKKSLRRHKEAKDQLRKARSECDRQYSAVFDLIGESHSKSPLEDVPSLERINIQTQYCQVSVSKLEKLQKKLQKPEESEERYNRMTDLDYPREDKVMVSCFSCFGGKRKSGLNRGLRLDDNDVLKIEANAEKKSSPQSKTECLLERSLETRSNLKLLTKTFDEDFPALSQAFPLVNESDSTFIKNELQIIEAGRYYYQNGKLSVRARLFRGSSELKLGLSSRKSMKVHQFSRDDAIIIELEHPEPTLEQDDLPEIQMDCGN
jgi:hypothetical protein